METKVLEVTRRVYSASEHIVKQNVFRKPTNLTFEEAAFLEPLSCVIHGMQGLQIKKVTGH